jgi:hypothetical protein
MANFFRKFNTRLFTRIVILIAFLLSIGGTFTFVEDMNQVFESITDLSRISDIKRTLVIISISTFMVYLVVIYLFMEYKEKLSKLKFLNHLKFITLALTFTAFTPGMLYIPDTTGISSSLMVVIWILILMIIALSKFFKAFSDVQLIELKNYFTNKYK